MAAFELPLSVIIILCSPSATSFGRCAIACKKSREQRGTPARFDVVDEKKILYIRQLIEHVKLAWSSRYECGGGLSPTCYTLEILQVKNHRLLPFANDNRGTKTINDELVHELKHLA